MSPSQSQMHRAGGGDGVHRLAESPDVDDHGHGHDQQGEEHQESLKQVGPADRQKPAQKGVSDDDKGSDKHRDGEIRAVGRLKQLAGPDQTGRRIKEEEEEDHQGGQNPQKTRLVTKTELEIIRQGQGIQHLGVPAEPFGGVDPVHQGPGRQPDGDPEGSHPHSEGESGQPQQEPAAHVAGLGAHGRNPAAQLSAAQHVIGEGSGHPVRDDPDDQHGDQIKGKGDDGTVESHIRTTSFFRADNRQFR